MSNYDLINFLIFFGLFIVLPGLPIWLFLRQRPNVVEGELKRFSNYKTPILVLMIVASIVDLVGQGVSKNGIVVSAAFLLFAGFSYSSVIGQLSTSGRKMFTALLLMGAIVFWTEVLVYALGRR